MPWSTLDPEYWVSFKDAAESALAKRGGLPSSAFQDTSDRWMSREDAEQLYVLNTSVATLAAKTDIQWVQKKDLESPAAPSCDVGTLRLVRLENPPPDPEAALNFTVSYGIEYNSGIDKYTDAAAFEFDMFDASSNYYGFRLLPLVTSNNQPVYSASGVPDNTTASSITSLYGGAVSSMSISVMNFKYIIRPYTASNTYYYELRKNGVVVWTGSEVLTNGVSATNRVVTVNIPMSFTLANGDQLSFNVTAANALPPAPTERYFTFRELPCLPGKGDTSGCFDKALRIEFGVKTVNGWVPPVNVTVNFNILFKYTSGGTTYTESGSLVIPAGQSYSTTTFVRESGSNIWGRKRFKYVGLSITSFSPTGSSGSTFVRQETIYQYL